MTKWGWQDISAGNGACSQETRVQSSSLMCWKERTRSHKYSDQHTLAVARVQAPCMPTVTIGTIKCAHTPTVHTVTIHTSHAHVPCMCTHSLFTLSRMHTPCMCTHHSHYLLLYSCPMPHWSCSRHQAHVSHEPAPGPLDLCSSCHPSVPADGSCHFNSLGAHVNG